MYEGLSSEPSHRREQSRGEVHEAADGAHEQAQAALRQAAREAARAARPRALQRAHHHAPHAIHHALRTLTPYNPTFSFITTTTITTTNPEVLGSNFRSGQV